MFKFLLDKVLRMRTLGEQEEME